MSNILSANTILKGHSHQYHIEKVLGQGSFGITYLATTTIRVEAELGSIDTTIKVAIKEFFMRDINGREGTSVTCSSKAGIYDDYKRKFAREARNLSGLKHRNIIKVLEAFEANNTCYYAMEYCEGGSLDSLIASKNGVCEAEAIHYFNQIASALQYMHDNKMLHLDLKPANIMLRANGELVLIDFGLSKHYDENGIAESSTTIGGGTPGYAPLEQSNYHEGKEFPVTMDVYALGATLYKMLTGERPADAPIILNEGFSSESLVNKGVSPNTIACIEKAMSPMKKQRYGSVKDMSSALTIINSKVSLPKEDNSPKSVISEETIINSITVETLSREKTVVVNNTTPPIKEQSEDKIEKVKSKEEKINNDGKSSRIRLIAILLSVFLAVCVCAYVSSYRSTQESKKEFIAQQMKEQERLDAEKAAKEKAEQERLDAETAAKKRAEQEAAEKAAKEKAEQERLDAETAAKKRAEQEAAEKAAKEKAERDAAGIITISGHDAVDLGLSVHWATCNIGASSPEDYGNYYAWGETRPKLEYTEDNSLTYGMKLGDIGGTTGYDVAHSSWGGTWRLPSNSELEELIDNCIWTWTTMNGNKGYKLTSCKNFKSIFLPATGWFDGSSCSSWLSGGGYWSSTPHDTVEAYRLYFNSGGRLVHWDSRYLGYSVRPVSE